MISEATSDLSGTWPIRAHANRFYGTVKVDGQHPRVAALGCAEGDVVLISLVGYDTSVSAVLASLWSRESVPFLVGDEVKWSGPRNLVRRPESYKQFSTALAGTKEMHYIALPLSAHLAEGILHPPDLPKPEEEDIPEEERQGRNGHSMPGPISLPHGDRTRFVLGNWDETAPHMRSFLGHLYGMRVLFLHKDEEHPEWPTIWANELWMRGSRRKLIEPLPAALGIKVWRLSDDLDGWSHLIGSGVRDGWLPWQAMVPTPQEEDIPALALVH